MSFGCSGLVSESPSSAEEKMVKINGLWIGVGLVQGMQDHNVFPKIA